MQYARIATKSLISVFAAAAAISAAAQTAPDQPDAPGLLRNVELTYSAMNTYSAKFINTSSMNGSDAQSKTNMEQSMTVTADSTGKFRVETTDVMGILMVYDGNTMWMYMPAANAYSKLPLHGPSASAGAGAMGNGRWGGANPLREYKNITRGVKEAKILRSEKLHVNDSDADCWVVSLEYGPLGSEASIGLQAAGFAFSDFARSATLWVDKGRYLVYQEYSTTKMSMPNTNTPINMKETSKVETFTVNEAVSPDVFTFTPPPGAREMDESKFMPQAAEAPKTQN